MIFNLILLIFALFVPSLAYKIHANGEGEREHKEWDIMHAKLFFSLCLRVAKGNQNANAIANETNEISLGHIIY